MNNDLDGYSSNQIEEHKQYSERTKSTRDSADP